jgi:hypothetical protein
MGLLKKLSAIFGLTLIAVAIANVEFGALMSLDPSQKLVLSNLSDDGCNSDNIQKDLDSGNSNSCVGSIGHWDAADILMIFEGSGLFLASFLRWPKKGRWAKRFRRMTIIVGAMMCGLAVADSFNLMPGASSAELSQLLPFPAPPIAVQLAVFSVGIFLLRGPKYVITDDSSDKSKELQMRKLHADMDRVYESGGNLGSLTSKKQSKGMSKYTTVKDLWIHQGLDEFEDEFESGMRDDYGGKMARACHLCSGQGCASCNHTGSIA